MEELSRETIADPRSSRVVTRTFVAKKGMGAVELMPLKSHSGITQCVINECPPLARDMRVLATTDHQQFTPDLGNPIQAVVMESLTEAVFMNVRRIKSGGGQYIGLHRRAKCQMASNADPHHTQLTRAMG